MYYLTLNTKRIPVMKEHLPNYGKIHTFYTREGKIALNRMRLDEKNIPVPECIASVLGRLPWFSMMP